MPSPFRRSRAVPMRMIALGSLLASGCWLSRPPIPLDRSQDARIRAEVASRFAAEPSLRSEALRVEVEAGMVMLHGQVEGMGAWQCAISNAGLVSGVHSVADYLVIERGKRDVQCLAPRPDSSVIVVEP